GEPERRIERAEQELEQTFVVRALEGDSHRPEPVAEPPHARGELRHELRPLARQLRREREARRRLRGPAVELLLRRQPVAGRVQLDGREPLRVEAEEVTGCRPRRVEPGLPRRIRPAGCADIQPWYAR